MDPLRPGLNLRRDLLADGLTDAEVRVLRRRGVLSAVRPGAYLHGPEPDDAPRPATCWRSVLRYQPWVRTR